MKILFSLFIIFFSTSTYSNPICENRIVNEKCGFKFFYKDHENICKNMKHNKDASEERIQSCINSLIKSDKEREREFILCENKVKLTAEYKNCIKNSEPTSIIKNLISKNPIILIFIGGAIWGFIVILFYVLLFLFKIIFYKNFRSEVKISFHDLLENFKPVFFINYLIGNLTKYEKNKFIGSWILLFFIILLLSSIFLKNNIIISYILYVLPIIILVGVCSHWYKDNKHHFFNKKQDRYNDDIDKRLNKLKDLLDKGIIDRQEYEKQREKIINEL